jgi:N-methylhydantoinase B
MVRGSGDLTVDYAPYAGLPHGAFGLFGGYPDGVGGLRAILEPGPGFGEALARGSYPTVATEVTDDGAGARVSLPPAGAGRVPVPEGHLLSDFTQGGGGYGDPLDREPEGVARDVRRHIVSRRVAELIYGVRLHEGGEVDAAGTEERRVEIRAERRTGVRAVTTPPEPTPDGPTLRFHEALDIVGRGAGAAVRCRRCGACLGPATDNYKRHALRRDRELAELAGRPTPDGSPYLAVLREYACPGCATLLQVDVWCASLGGEEDLWDIRIAR